MLKSASCERKLCLMDDGMIECEVSISWTRKPEQIPVNGPTGLRKSRRMATILQEMLYDLAKSSTNWEGTFTARRTSAQMIKHKNYIPLSRPRDTGIQSIQNNQHNKYANHIQFHLFPPPHSAHGASTPDISFQATFTTMRESVHKCDCYGGEEKNTQCARTPFVVVGDGTAVAD